MSVFNGKHIYLDIYGESHAEKIGVSVKGFPGFTADMQKLTEFLERRKPSSGVFSTKRREPDVPIFSGINDGKITGEFTAEIINTDRRSADYGELYGKPRPSHADYAWYLKDGALDFSGGGRFSGRLTAPLCIAGGLAAQYLEMQGIYVSAYVAQVGTVKGASYKSQPLDARIAARLREGEFPSLSKKREMLEEIDKARKDCDSVGGVIECIISGTPGGKGDNLFGGLEGKIASLVYAVPAVKGVEFGWGFALSTMRGSRANDGLHYENGKVRLLSNRAGGINGGISNGEDITFSAAMRPTPSIFFEQRTVDLVKGEDTVIKIKGRHDACIVPRAVPAIESAAALAVLDEIL